MGRLPGIRLWLVSAAVAGLLGTSGATYGEVEREALTNALGMEFVLIRPGTFQMGSPAEEPGRYQTEVLHPVTITQPFYLQTTEVTLAQWRSAMGKGFFLRRPGPDQFPVSRVSWYDAMEFIQKLNKRGDGVYRLPTEAEWEYAARAGTTTAYSWGETSDCAQAMFSNNRSKSPACIEYVRSRGFAVGSPAPVGSYPPNPWGLYDMAGNLWEWCSDWYAPYSPLDREDPKGPRRGTNKVRRGGSWYKHDYYSRPANRASGHPATRYKTTGFRLVREVSAAATPPVLWPPEEEVPSK